MSILLYIDYFILYRKYYSFQSKNNVFSPLFHYCVIQELRILFMLQKSSPKKFPFPSPFDMLLSATLSHILLPNDQLVHH